MTEEQRQIRAKANWQYLRKKLKPASRELLKQQLLLDPNNLHAIVRLGIACCDSSSSATPSLTRLAVLLLDKAILHGFDPSECYGGEGHFWKKYARAHTVCWECGGGHLPGAEYRGRERLHLERSLQGWEQALHYMSNATDPKCWSECALVSQRLGDYETAANVLGKLIQSFPDDPNSASTSIYASSVLAQLQHYEQAIMYMHHALITGASAPLTNLHLMFFMSRLHEKWARSKNPNFERAPFDALDQAEAGYARCYEFEEERGGVMFRTEWAVGGSKGWINSNTTWKQMGDAATYSRQYLLASDLYAEGVRRDPPKPLRSAPYIFLSRAYMRAGKVDAAIESAETAIEINQREIKKYKAKGKKQFKDEIASYENWLDKLTNPKTDFNDELRMDPVTMLDKYAHCIPSANTLRQVPAALVARNRALELRSKALAKAKGKGGRSRGVVRWEALRDKLKGAARRYYQMRLLQNPKNGYSGAMLAQMGILCVDNGPQSTPQMDRCAAIILQKAADAGYSGDPEVPNSEANFWLNFSRAHFKLWMRDGIRAERIHLKRASWGWEKALTHVRVACDVGCWREAATVHFCLGDYPRAAQMLGILIRSFPGFPGLPAVQLDVAMLLFQLQQYDQAYAYARAAMSTNRLPPPFTHMDLLFFIARICDKLSIQADEDRETARIERRARRAELKEQRFLEKERERLERISNGEEEEDEGDNGEDGSDLSSGEDEDSTETEGEDLGGERRDMAEKARMKVMQNFKDSNLVDKSVELEDWLNDPDTYKTFAKRAVDGGKYLIAVDLYRDALTLARKIDTPDDVESDSDCDGSTLSETSKELRKRKKREAKEERRRRKKQGDSSSQLVDQQFDGEEEEKEEEEKESKLSPDEVAEKEKIKYKRVVSLWFGLAKAHCRCGQMEDAIRACKEGLSCPTEDGDKFENVLSHWSELSEGSEEDRERITAFEQEVNTDLPSILDKYVAGEKTMLSIDWDAIDDYNKPKTGDTEVGKKESQIVAKYRKKLSGDWRQDRSEDLKSLHTIEDIEGYMVKKRRWQIMREGVKGVAREVMKDAIFGALMKMAGKMERDCGDVTIKNIAFVGFSCASETTGGNDTVNMFVGACLLLAKAFDYGWLDIVKKEHSLDEDGGEEAMKNAEARLWKTRALCHWRVYEKQGCGAGKGEKVHLEHCLTSWDKALKHLSVASDLKCWMCYARAALAKGDYQVAANAYGTILKSFRIPDKVGIALVCSSLLKALGVYDQAIAYMFSAISMAGMAGGPGNYDSIDLAFLMARLHEEHGWFEQQKQEGGDGGDEEDCCCRGNGGRGGGN
jgi:tetratricopeptide (TPR) repeat protein